jgi:methyltransferase
LAAAETLLLLLIVFVPMLFEARRSARNERTQRARGGIEPPGDVYDLMRVAYPIVFLAMIAEGFWRSERAAFASVDSGIAMASVSLSELALAGFLLFMLAKALKWWAIRSLGRSWTFRVIVVPGDPLVARGPYAWIRHPNYVAVAGELMAVALMSGAAIAGPIGTVAFGALMLKRIAVEERARHQTRAS